MIVLYGAVGLYGGFKHCGITTIANGEAVTEINEFYMQLHDKMCMRDEKIYITYSGADVSSLNEEYFGSMISKALFIDDESTSSDADYLSGSIERVHDCIRYYNDDGSTTFYIHLEYTESKEQLKIVDERVRMIIASLVSGKESEAEKVRLVHDWIVDNVEYDSSLEKRTAYDALTEGITVCRGYASLMYKMLLECGVDCSIVCGCSKSGGAHAWNLVKMDDGKWYWMDVTWNDGGGIAESGEKYYLRGAEFLETHIPDPEYMAESYMIKHPVSEERYWGRSENAGFMGTAGVSAALLQEVGKTETGG